MDTSIILQHQKKREWKEPRPSGEYVGKKRRSSHKVAELNNSDRIVATTTVIMPKEGAITASSVIEAIPGPEAQKENKDKENIQNIRKRKKADLLSNSTSKSKSDTNNVSIDIMVRDHKQVRVQFFVL